MFTALPNSCNVDQVDPGWFPAGGRYFKYDSTASGNYEAVKQHCVDLGGHLATFKTDDDLALLKAIRGHKNLRNMRSVLIVCLSF